MRVSSHGGHNAIIQGANSGGRKEHEMDRELNSLFISKLRSLGHSVENDTDDSGRTASAIVGNQIRNINDRANDVGFSWHLNASDGSGHGVEVLCYSEKEAPMAAKISAEISKRTGWRDRGAKVRPDIGVIRSSNCPFYLIEAGFIDNDGDMSKWNPDAITSAVIYAYFGQESSSSSVPAQGAAKGYRVVIGDFDDVIWFGKAYELMKGKYGSNYSNWFSVNWSERYSKYIFQAKFGDFNKREYAQQLVDAVKKDFGYGAWIIEV